MRFPFVMTGMAVYVFTIIYEFKTGSQIMTAWWLY